MDSGKDFTKVESLDRSEAQFLLITFAERKL